MKNINFKKIDYLLLLNCNKNFTRAKAWKMNQLIANYWQRWIYLENEAVLFNLGYLKNNYFQSITNLWITCSVIVIFIKIIIQVQ